MVNDELTSLGLEQQDRYRIAPQAAWRRWSPAKADQMGKQDPKGYREYVDHSCDLTMRGGTTSGVIYPLAVCALAEQYQFRSVGGASAGAIGAVATAAAEYGRYKDPVPKTDKDAVQPGFAGLAGLITWLVSEEGAARWRLPQLFQPKASLHRVFRLVTALMQSKETTGRVRFGAVFTALLCAVRLPMRFVFAVLFAGWLVGPYAVRWLLPPDRWNGTDWTLAGVLAGVALIAAIWAIRTVAPRIGKITLLLLLPFVIGLTGILLYPADVRAWLVAGAIITALWLLLTFGVVAVFATIYGRALWPVVTNYRKHRFGLVPGAEEYTPTWVDKLCGMAESTQVPPLATWLANRVDDLAGMRRERALTFGDLWKGPSEDDEDNNRGEMGKYCPEPGDRVINLALMTTDLTAGRPYQLPFQPEHGWQFCPECLKGIVPDRIVEQMSEKAAGINCTEHKQTGLYELPEPADIPVVLAARMSLPLPGLICPVPLYRDGKPHWFSDGGITSNFPIHFFDSLLPRWPTFGLNLTSKDEIEPGEVMVDLPEQDSKDRVPQHNDFGRSMLSFVSRILDTFLSWRDTMQAELPGFRGRIATVVQGPGEGGTNLFMSPEIITRLALRGHEAGTKLRTRFVDERDGEADGFTRTDRYRWIRMRLALREIRELAMQADARALLYKDGVAKYRIPACMGDWFAGPKPPLVEPRSADIIATFEQLADTANNALARELDGTTPINPVLRLTPPE